MYMTVLTQDNFGEIFFWKFSISSTKTIQILGTKKYILIITEL